MTRGGYVWFDYADKRLQGWVHLRTADWAWVYVRTSREQRAAGWGQLKLVYRITAIHNVKDTER